MVDNVTGMPAFSMANNEDFVRTVQLVVGTQPYDLTGHTVALEVRSRPQAAETLISIDNQELGGIVVENPPTAGVFTFWLNQVRLIRMPPGDYYYDVVITRPEDQFHLNLGINVLTVAQGITR